MVYRTKGQEAPTNVKQEYLPARTADGLGQPPLTNPPCLSGGGPEVSLRPGAVPAGFALAVLRHVGFLPF